MAEIINLPFDEEREWRRSLPDFREAIAEAGVSPKIAEKVLRDFREIHRKLHYSQCHQLICDEGFSPSQVESVTRLVGEIKDGIWFRVSIAEYVILDLLIEKYR